jgi:hypothetical protein
MILNKKKQKKKPIWINLWVPFISQRHHNMFKNNHYCHQPVQIPMTLPKFSTTKNLNMLLLTELQNLKQAQQKDFYFTTASYKVRKSVWF